MSYAAAIERLHALGHELHTEPGKPRRKFDLAHMRMFMKALGDPQREFRSILVAGTNGKGSTCAALASILTHAGYRTGLYTSPHLIRVNERIQVDGVILSDEDFGRLFFQVDEAAAVLVREGRLPGSPSFFETVTAMAFLHFQRQRVHTAVLEVGMGGRLDATNIVEPLVSVITDISLDHMEWLGGTVAEIAREKAGILRANGIMVTLPQHPEANQALGEAAMALGVRAISAAEYVPAAPRLGKEEQPSAEGRLRYSIMLFGKPVEIDSPLTGAHQQRNLALTIATAAALRSYYSYNIEASGIQAGIRETAWPGRLERIPGRHGQPALLLDVCHNPGGAWALRAAISHLDRGQPLTLVFGCLRDKPVAELAQILFPLFQHVVVTPVDSPRSAPVEEMLDAAKATGSEVEPATDPADALVRAISRTPADGLIAVAGSIYLVGAVRAQIAPPPFTAAEMQHL